ncbi:MAG: serine/threonine-protein kinase, partial [Gemmata sp.]
GITELAVRMHARAAGDEVPTVDLPVASASGSRPVPLSAGAGPATATAPGSPAPLYETRVAGARAEPDVTAIPGYQLVRVLGRGGMGVVYEAVQAATGERVAVKTILPAARLGGTAVAKFVREADIVRRLDHPGIVRFLDSGDAGGTAWFAMEFVSGGDAQTLSAHGPLPVGRAVGWVVQALEAIQYAHDRGFVHRDVKPSNLLVSSGPGRAEVVKVADFGLARAYEASPLSGLTLTGAAGGTPSFMPPEQVLDMRSVKPPADQYSCAATLYRLLAGHNILPQCPNVEELFTRILQSDPLPITTHRPDLRSPLTDAIHRALSRDPEARYPNCRAFATALKPFAG